MPVKKKFVPINARSGAVEVLEQVLCQGAYTNIAINKYLRQHQLSDLDRRLMTELVYGTVKALGTVDWYLKQVVDRPLERLEDKVLQVLRSAVYQLFYMERIPASAACNEAVKLARSYSNEGSAKFVNGVLRNLLRKKDELVFPNPEEDDLEYLALKYYHPKWLLKRWLGVFGKEGTVKLCEFDNSPALVCLRVNTLVTDQEALMTALTEAGAEVRASAWSDDGIVCEKLPALGEMLKKLERDFYVQDESSMLVADVLGPEPGQKVLDMCSAPGGKTTHIAQLMDNEGSIIACDIHAHKLELIRDNAQRLGIKIIEPTLKDATVYQPEWREQFDRVLVDAPCSGLGVLRRRAEARWRESKKNLQEFPPLQLRILENACRYVKPEGTLVYSTCTVEYSENHYLVQKFLEKHPEWEYAGVRHPLTGEKLEELQLLPQVDGIDGFYICALKKK